ncbi:MarR family winged helix-turn-helix transcriptional regulator [Streptomyces odonnellii]|uniref:MarR family winged helix-turn-helix transcriptional regulator n=1 Tax=Streptomyces odonnellii TaxID=1417980 RepID=UPI000696DC96|nr:MarR family transcriptional regulator [Streptomyces odonnellii]
MSIEEKGAAARASTLASDLALAMTRLRARLRTETSSRAGRSTGRWSWAQLATLTRIIENGPVTASELAKAENVRQQSMSEILTALRKDGLVRTERDPEDGRKVLLIATPEGEEVSREMRATRDAWLASALRDDVTETERETIEAAIHIINRLAERRS